MKKSNQKIDLLLKLSKITLLHLYSHFFLLFRATLKKRFQKLFTFLKRFHAFKTIDIKSKTNSLITKNVPLSLQLKEAIHSYQSPKLENTLLKKQSKDRLFIDVSYLAFEDANTGIQRVIKELISSLYALKEDCPYEVVVVHIDPRSFKDPKMILAKRVIESLGLNQSKKITDSYQEINFEKGDIFLMADATWGIDYTKFYPIFEKARKALVPIITVVYDILPLTLNKKIIGNWLEGVFETWFRRVVKCSDGLLTISLSEQAAIKKQLQVYGIERQSLSLNHWALGYKKPKRKEVEDKEHFFKIPKKPFLLMVGTIEPRKAHPLALSAMEILWSKGTSLSLCIAGSIGWNSEIFMKRLNNHSQLNRSCFFIEKPCDDHLQFLYKHAEALLFLSYGEGFGLPLIEAASYGLPIVCSDIPVFNEVAGAFATYIKLGAPDYVAAQLEKWWRKNQLDPGPSTLKMPCLNWEESSKGLLGKLSLMAK